MTNQKYQDQRKQESPPEITALGWIQAIIAPHPKFQRGKLVAKSNVKRGGEAELISYNAKPPAPITLSKMPFEIAELGGKYQWAKPRMGVSHEHAQN